VLTALRFTPEYGRAALDSARGRGEDVVLCLVVDREISEAVTDQLVDVGFLGEKLRHRLRDTMIAGYRERGLANLEELLQTAKAMSLGAEREIVDGPFLASVLEVAAKHHVARIVVARVRRPDVSIAFFGKEIDRLVKKAPCPVDVFDWTGSPILSGSGPGAASA
jgi:nucleotide-binding universal stress UspA family protein